MHRTLADSYEAAVGEGWSVFVRILIRFCKTWRNAPVGGPMAGMDARCFVSTEVFAWLQLIRAPLVSSKVFPC